MARRGVHFLPPAFLSFLMACILRSIVQNVLRCVYIMLRARNINAYFSTVNHRAGFTLVELLVVISIIGILAMIAVPRFANVSESAKRAKIMADLRTIDSAFEIYYVTSGSYPADIFHPCEVLVSAGYLTHVPVPPAVIKDNDGTVYEIPPYVICTSTIADKAGRNRAIVKIGSYYYDVDHLKSELKW